MRTGREHSHDTVADTTIEDGPSSVSLSAHRHPPSPCGFGRAAGSGSPPSPCGASAGKQAPGLEAAPFPLPLPLSPHLRHPQPLVPTNGFKNPFWRLRTGRLRQVLKPSPVRTPPALPAAPCASSASTRPGRTSANSRTVVDAPVLRHVEDIVSLHLHRQRSGAAERRSSS